MNNTAAAWVEALGVGVRALSADSRTLAADTAFLAYPGDSDDGRRYIGAAVKAGAAGVFWESENFCWQRQWQLPNVAVHNLKMNCGYLADVVYGEPSRHLPLVAVTGTNGKTTVSHFVAQLLQHAGIISGIIGTLGAGTLGALTPLANTTPDAATLHDWLRRFIDAGAKAAVLEASSHGIHQGRLNGLRLAAAVFTNAAHDHLDYHDNVEAYWQAKAQLFAMPAVGAAILNADDAFCRRLAASVASPRMTYGKAGEELRLLQMQFDEGGCFLHIDGVFGRRQLRLPFAGEHNVYNFLAAALAAAALNVAADDILAAAAALVLPSGRLEKISSAPAVYVDYAHTPAAMAAVLAAARPLAAGGRLIIVFGAGGERDVAKRAEMGRIATAADVAIVTDDNPRREDAAAIRAALCRAVPEALNIGDRREAIAAALAQARREDMVLILGKGHESTQQIGEQLLPFSDAAVVREWLGERQE